MTDSREQITERVVQTAEDLEELTDPDAINYLEAKVSASLDGTLREVTVVLETGGPQIEVNTTQGKVHGFWGGESHTTHVNSEAVVALDDRLSRQWEHADPEA